MLRSHKLALGFANWGAKDIPVSDMIDTVKYALEHGIDEIDCAPHYGNGMRETLLGVARLGLPQKLQEKLKISTKVGRVIDPDKEAKEDHGFTNTNSFDQHFDYTYKGIKTSFHDSQLRLNVKNVNALYLHDLEKGAHGDEYKKRREDFLKSGYIALEELKDKGNTAVIGLGSNDVDACIDLIKTDKVKIDRILLAGCYNLLNFKALESGFFSLCKEKKIEIYIAAPYCGGILSGNGNTSYNYSKADKSIVDKVESIKKVCDEFKVDLANAAMQFVCLHPQVKRVVVGARTIKELDESLKYATTVIEPKFWEKLKEKGIIPKQAPTELTLSKTVSKSLKEFFSKSENKDDGRTKISLVDKVLKFKI